MSGERPLVDSLEDLFEKAPCGYLTTRVDGTITAVNHTFETWTGLKRRDLVGHRRFQQLLSSGGRIYHETHYAPLLRMQGSVRAIAVEIVRADGSRLSALINSDLHYDENGEPQAIRTVVFDATERRGYEQELLSAQRREHEIAQQLQRSLLAGGLPAAPDLEVGVSYRSAVSGTEVGGDWYDAFWLDDTSVGLVVGDVVGRGIDAAAAMGQLRSAVRALASTGIGPSAVLDGLDAYVLRYGVGDFATVVYCQLDLGDGALRYACAGHPPPLVTAPEPHFLWEGRSTPMGARLAGARAEAQATLPPGAALVLYTDGLVERRTTPLDVGMDRLLAEVATVADDPPSDMAESLVRAFHDPEHTDDVCLLVARRV